MNTAKLSKRIPKLHILVGIPGCGKSTFARGLTGTVVSTDQLREELAKSVSDQSKNDLVFTTFHNTLRWGLEEGFDMIADSTALDQFAREKLAGIARETGAESHVYLFRNTLEAILRNRRRERVVPDSVMQRMIEKYERSLLEIPQAHYTTVTEIRSTR